MKKTSQKGINLIQKFEGCKLYPYFDSGGIKTIGYGHALKSNESYTKISAEDAEAILKKDIEIFEDELGRLLNVEELEQNEYDALISFIFNIGGAKFKNSTVYRALSDKKKDYVKAMTWWAKWIRDANNNKLLGLILRRKEEIMLFNEDKQKMTHTQISRLFDNA